MRQLFNIALWVTWVTTVVLAPAAMAQGDNYFPLQVGNRWTYELVGEENVTDSRELVIADTIRLAVDQILADTLWGDSIGTLPHTSEGIVYYLLQGTALELLMGRAQLA